MSPKSPSEPRVALYARVSTLGQGQDPEVQLQPLRRLAEQRGWQVIGEFVDIGVSGAKESRPQLDKLMLAAKAGELDVIAVYKFDRFARSTRHLLGALDEFRQSHVDFVSLTESVDTSTPVGRMVFTFLGAVAEFERCLIVERVKSGLAKAKGDGVHCGRPRKDLDLRAAQALIAQGQSVREVSDMLGLPRSTLRRRLGEMTPSLPEAITCPEMVP